LFQLAAILGRIEDTLRGGNQAVGSYSQFLEHTDRVVPPGPVFVPVRVQQYMGFWLHDDAV